MVLKNFINILSKPGFTTWKIIRATDSFRYAKYYVEDKLEKRTLMKVFGVRIDIIVHGRVSIFFLWVIYKEITAHAHFNLCLHFFSQAGKFDIIPTLTAIGSGVGIFGVVSDVLALQQQ